MLGGMTLACAAAKAVAAGGYALWAWAAGGAAVGALVMGGISIWMVENAKDEGFKDGYAAACADSSGFQKKLRDMKKDFEEQAAEIEKAYEQVKDQRDEALDLGDELIERLFSLYGQFDGCITSTREHGWDVDPDIEKDYQQIKKLARNLEDKIRENDAA